MAPSKLNGKLADPEFRRERAQLGGAARHTLDVYIRSIADRAPELTPTQVERLRALLPIAGGDAK